VDATEVVGDLLLLNLGDVRHRRRRKIVQQTSLQAQSETDDVDVRVAPLQPINDC
jgi:hypothetical protein